MSPIEITIVVVASAILLFLLLLLTQEQRLMPTYPCKTDPIQVITE